MQHELGGRFFDVVRILSAVFLIGFCDEFTQQDEHRDHLRWLPLASVLFEQQR